MNNCPFGKTHIFSHTAIGDLLLETVNIMGFAHPVFAGFTETALMAGDNLFSQDAIANF